MGGRDTRRFRLEGCRFSLGWSVPITYLSYSYDFEATALVHVEFTVESLCIEEALAHHWLDINKTASRHWISTRGSHQAMRLSTLHTAAWPVIAAPIDTYRWRILSKLLRPFRLLSYPLELLHKRLSPESTVT